MRMYTFGFMEFDYMLEKLAAIPESTKVNMMKAAAEEYKKHLQKTMQTTGQMGYFNTKSKKFGGGGRYSTGKTANNIIIKKQGSAIYVTWDHNVRHDKGVTFADVAFLTEYGVPGRGIPARPFIAQATQEGLLDAYSAALDVLNQELDL